MAFAVGDQWLPPSVWVPAVSISASLFFLGSLPSRVRGLCHAAPSPAKPTRLKCAKAVRFPLVADLSLHLSACDSADACFGARILVAVAVPLGRAARVPGRGLEETRCVLRIVSLDRRERRRFFGGDFGTLLAVCTGALEVQGSVVGLDKRVSSRRHRV
ncbi:hypothetical protein VTK73DRAFT_6079 [Phialemonium thermophilum]|uniref:Secreted protein n=1 Tax=Phialemonium thermophilum TaxID=223376 RepID=A0ABR3WL24_9PEZI